MHDTEKETLKATLADPTSTFNEAELQGIIDREFFDDSARMDTELVDMAAQRLANLCGVSEEEVRKRIANRALHKLLIKKKPADNRY